MDVTGIASTMSGMSAGQLHLSVGTVVLGRAIDVASSAALQLVASMTAAAAPAHGVPAGLTFSPAGLSAAESNRVIATL